MRSETLADFREEVRYEMVNVDNIVQYDVWDEELVQEIEEFLRE